MSLETPYGFRTLTEDPADHVTYSPDGRLLSILNDQVIRVWDAYTHNQLQVLEQRGRLFQKATFSPDGQFLAAAGWGGNSVLVWNLTTGQLVAELLGHTDMVLAVAFLPGGQEIVSASRDHTLRHWDWPSGRLIRTLIGHARPVMGLDVSPDGQYVASGSADGTARVWEVASGRVLRLFRGGFGTVQAVALDESGTLLAMAGGNHTHGSATEPLGGVAVLSIAHNRRVFSQVDHRAVIGTLAFSPDGSILLTGDAAGHLRMFEVPTGTCSVDIQPETEDGPVSWVTSVCFHPLGDRLTFASHSGVQTYGPELNAHQPETDALPIGTHEGEVTDLALSTDGSLLVSCAGDGTIHLWNVPERRLADVLGGDDGPATALALCPVTGRIAVGHRQGEDTPPLVCIWNPAEGRSPKVLDALGSATTSMAYSPDGRWLALGLTQGDVALYDTSTWWRVSTRIHHPHLTRLAFSPDGQSLVTSGMYPETKARRWALPAGALEWEVDLATLPGHGSWFNDVAVGPQGTLVALAEDGGTLRLWNLGANAEVTRFDGHTGYVWRVQFSGDGRTLVSGAWDRTVRVWNLGARREACRLNVGEHVLALAVSADGALVAAGDRAGQVHVWRLWEVQG